MFKKLKHVAKVTESVIREKIKSHKRSSKWDSVRDEYVKNNPACVACGSKRRIQVHHIEPVSNRPDLELDQSNLLTLCMDVEECHFRIGHGGSFKHYNPDVLLDAKKFKETNDKKERAMVIENARAKRLD
jgi:5-methylcytosine-specific restriction endonuclease McrA